MNIRAIINVVCIIALGFILWPLLSDYAPSDWTFGLGGQNCPAVDVAKPTNTYGFDSSIPGALHDKATAQKLAGMFNGLADVFAHDASRSKPEIRYASNVRDTLHTAVTIEFDGQKLNDAASGLGDVVGPEFEKAFPDGSVELDSSARQKAADMFRAVAYGCTLVK